MKKEEREKKQKKNGEIGGSVGGEQMRYWDDTGVNC